MIDLGDKAGKRHVRMRAHGTSGPVAGAAGYTNGLSAHKKRAAYSSCVLPRSPIPERATLPVAPDGPVRSSEADSHASTPRVELLRSLEGVVTEL